MRVPPPPFRAAPCLPLGGVPDGVEAAQRFTEALNGGEALGLIREMNLNPTGPGVEPFLRALQASTDAAQKEASSTSSAGARLPMPRPNHGTAGPFLSCPLHRRFLPHRRRTDGDRRRREAQGGQDGGVGDLSNHTQLVFWRSGAALGLALALPGRESFNERPPAVWGTGCFHSVTSTWRARASAQWRSDVRPDAAIRRGACLR